LIWQKKINQHDLGPVYSLHLDYGFPLQADLERIREKMEVIREQYSQHGQELKVCLIGHSRGAELAFLSGISDCFIDESGLEIYDQTSSIDQTIDKIICLRTNMSPIRRTLAPEEYFDRVYEIYGVKDTLVTISSNAVPDHQLAVNTGHFGMLYSDQVHNQIIDWTKA
jgi:hypothetical protein